MTVRAAPPHVGRPPEAVVFDCDGLLVDTESCWTAAETRLCARHGATFTARDEATLVGASVPRACALLAERCADGTDAVQVERELIDDVMAIVAREGRAMPGAVELVRAIADRVPVAVASNSPRALLDQALGCAGLTGAFDATVAADEVPAPKPAPDLYLAACVALDAAPGRALALEDSATGIAAATAAGLDAIAVPTLPGGDLGARWTVPALTEPWLVAWVRRWPVRR